MTVAEQHSAGPSIAGFIFQLDRAIEWLATASEGSSVGIESLDDVVLVDAKGQFSIEQDKLSFRRNPISDRSNNFWNSLGIWIGLIDSGECDLEVSRFYLVTNQPVNTGIASKLKLDADQRNSPELIAQLRELASEANDAWATPASTLLGKDDGYLKDFVSRIQVIDSSPFGLSDDANRHLGNVLGLPASIVDPVIDGIRGWIVRLVCLRFAKRARGLAEETPAWIGVESFRDIRSSLIAKYYDTRLTVRAAKEIAISPELVDAALGEVFVRQLEAILFDEDYPDDFIEAITDFLRSKEERTRLAEQNAITSKAFGSYEANLRDHWRIVRRRVLRTPLSSEEKTGQQVLDQSLSHQPLLDGHTVAEGYLSRGTYHELANHLFVGWHPRFDSLLKGRSS